MYLIRYFAWHYKRGLEGLFEIGGNALWFVPYFFSTGSLLRTLFAPWKRDVEIKTWRGIRPVKSLQLLFDNLFSRLIGALVRSFFILGSLALEMLAFAIFSLVFLLWILAPLAVAVLFSTASILAVSLGYDAILGVTLFLLTGLSMYGTFKIFQKSRQPSCSEMSLDELSAQPWFARVWNRLGLDSQRAPFAITDTQKLDDFLGTQELKHEDFNHILHWEMERFIEHEEGKKFWTKKNLEKIIPIGRNWSYAYTVILDNYALDLSASDPTPYKQAHLVGREEQVKMLELILTRPLQNNVLLVGEPGIGKNTLVHSLARTVRHRRCTPALFDTRILKLDLGRIISGVIATGELEALLYRIFDETAYAGNIILFVNDLEKYLQSETALRTNVSRILGKYLPYPSFRVIGTASPEGFSKHIENNSFITKHFEIIRFEEPAEKEVISIMLNALKNQEARGVCFSFAGLKQIYKMADRFISDAPMPEKALDMMEEVIIFHQQHATEPFIGRETVNKFVTQKTNIPVGEINNAEREKLMELEQRLHARIVGQHYAVRQIAEAARRARIGIGEKNKPIASFLFMGPTGVGKTESAKALAWTFFGNEERMIRLDMSEFQTMDSIERLIGSTITGRQGVLIRKVKDNPFSLLLLDEIEKAHRDVLDLFLQVLDEGYISDAFGKKANMRNLIIIATSNAGSDMIKDLVEQNVSDDKIQKQLTDYVIRQNIFKPEFLNRFEGVIFFHPLSIKEISQVTKLILYRIAENFKEEKNIELLFTDKLVEAIVQKGYDKVFGARSIARFARDSIEDYLVKQMIAGVIKEGDEVKLDENILQESAQTSQAPVDKTASAVYTG